MMLTDHLLSLLIWLPIIGGFAVLGLGERAAMARWVSLGLSGVTFLLSVPLWTSFKTGTAAMQFVERTGWMPAIHSDFYIGVDGISMPLIVLTTFTTVLIVISGWQNVEKRVSQYFAAFLILEGLMIGVFAALDGVLFYVFWEAMLLPMFIIIGIWGGPRRVYATIKFFLYTFIGSLLMLVALIYMYLKAGTYELAAFQQLPLTLSEQTFIFLAFFAAFAVKVPMWPVHTWLPDAHVEAPTGGSVVLAAIMLKMGGYGFLRFSLPIAPDASRELDWLIIALSLIAVVYIGFVALVQRDMKKLIAYSSIAHMGFVTLGAFIGYQIFAHTGRTSRHRDGHGRRHGADAVARPGVRGDVPQRGRHVRPHAQPRDQRVRRRHQHHAEIRRVHGAVRHGQLRPARDFGLRRGVSGDSRRIQGQSLVRVPGGDHTGAGRRLHVVAGQTGALRRDRQRQGAGAQGSERPRVLRAGCARGGRAVGRPVARTAARRAARVDPSPDPAAAGFEDPSLRPIHERV